MEQRPPIPAELKREILVEAGHRCAIPTCRQTPVEIAHIIPWSKVKEHTADNLIALCPTCHTRYDRGDIDRKAMQQYKANLFLLNCRYNDTEIRILEHGFAQNNQAMKLPGNISIMLSYLIKDGLLAKVGEDAIYFNGTPANEYFQLTTKGMGFVQKYMAGNSLE